MIELIDSHCHLNYDYAPKSVEDLLREAQAAGVTHMMTVGTELATIADVERISEAHPILHHTVGVHPHEAISLTEADIETLRKASRHPKCRAIGEIGLDYYYEHSPHEAQKQALRWQLDLAAERKLPVVIHSRDAEPDLLVELTRYRSLLSDDQVPGVIHCFTGTKEFGQRCLEMGFYISFSGILTFKKADDLRDCAREFPLDRILVETDSPYLAPIPMRGRKCEPSMVRYTAEKLAEIKGLSLEEVAATTTRNARRAFSL